jgi:hypothetical protein
LTHDSLDVVLHLVVGGDQDVQAILLDHLEVLGRIYPPLVEDTRPVRTLEEGDTC